MKMFILMALFSAPDSLAPHQAEGLGPRPAPSLEVCLERRARLHQYLIDNVKPGVKFTTFCVEVEMRGYQEAVDAFRHQIGERM